MLLLMLVVPNPKESSKQFSASEFGLELDRYLFQANTDINILEIFRPIPISITDILTTKFCHYVSINLTLKATQIPFQRKTIANTSHNLVLFTKTNLKYNDLAINSQERPCLLSKINSLR